MPSSRFRLGSWVAAACLAPLLAAAAPAYVAHILLEADGRPVYPGAINDAGVVTGHTHVNGRHLPVLGFIGDGSRSVTFAWGDGVRTSPIAINASGDVAGSSEDASNHTHAWVRHHDRDINLLPGTNYGGAVGVNASGVVTGYSDVTGFTWKDGLLTRLPGLDYPAGINDAGVVVGETQQAAGRSVAAVRWIDGHLDLLPDLPQGFSFDGSSATAINARGDIVGYCYAPDNLQHGCLWHDGTVDDIGMLPGNFDAAPYAINDAGIIVGASDTGTWLNAAEHAFIKYPGQPIQDLNDLVSVPGMTFGYAYGVNNSGQILAEARGDLGQRYYRLDPILAR